MSTCLIRLYPDITLYFKQHEPIILYPLIAFHMRLQLIQENSVFYYGIA